MRVFWWCSTNVATSRRWIVLQSCLECSQGSQQKDHGSFGHWKTFVKPDSFK
jgi:hypothetical protein